MSKPKIKVELSDYMHKCGDGCYTNYGTITKVNGTELFGDNQNTGIIIIKILEHLDYEVEIIETFNGE